MAGRIIVGLAIVLLVAAAMSVAQEEKAAAEAKPWFDMENCDMCKNFASNPDLMKGMTWEQVNISNGFMSVSSMAPELVPAFREANAKCEVLGDKLMAGETAPLCGSCDAFGALLAAGAEMEQIELKNGGVMLMTSADPAVVATIHAWTDHNAVEMEKMMSAMDAGAEE